VSRDAQQQDWTELGAGCWVRRYAEWNVNVGVVAGEDGLLVVDTRGTAEQGHTLRDDVRRLDPRPVRWVVNTHAHFDHVLGNVAFDDARIHAHENAADGLEPSVERVRGLCRADDPDDPLNRAVMEAPLRHPDRTYSSVLALDLGGRLVEMFHPGRGHTDGDTVIRVGDLDVVFAGDLVEEAGPPGYGGDCFPLDWPETLDLTMSVIAAGTTVVPGHGAPVDQAFVADQRADIGAVATTISGLAQSGVPAAEALRQGEWPWDPHLLEDAVRRGYEQLEPPQRGLPVIS
jgi:glyoxylase-like metal-dependent hydrolase (beta-lactamase superfamily II)